MVAERFLNIGKVIRKVWHLLRPPSGSLVKGHLRAEVRATVPGPRRSYTAAMVPARIDPNTELTEAQVKHLVLDPEPLEEGEEVPLRRYALLLAFNGHPFTGMQRNDSGASVEDFLLRALLTLGLITHLQFYHPKLLFFQRTSRTDKGVSAARMLVSCDFSQDVRRRIGDINALLPDTVQVMAGFRVTNKFDCKRWCDSRTYSYMCPSFAFAPVTEVVRGDYRMSSHTLQELRAQLARFRGSHNFHNFTQGIKPHQAQAMRVIRDIECGEPFERSGLQWVTITLRGQSFLLHQIRKMMGVVMAVMRGLVGPSFITAALSRQHVLLPIAPALGLVLEDQHFDFYNSKCVAVTCHKREPLTWDSLEDKIQDYREKIIEPSIVKGEVERHSMLQWLQTLYLFNYTLEQVKQDLQETHNPLRYANWLIKDLRRKEEGRNISAQDSGDL